MLVQTSVLSHSIIRHVYQSTWSGSVYCYVICILTFIKISSSSFINWFESVPMLSRWDGSRLAKLQFNGILGSVMSKNQVKFQEISTHIPVRKVCVYTSFFNNMCFQIENKLWWELMDVSFPKTIHYFSKLNLSDFSWFGLQRSLFFFFCISILYNVPPKKSK